MTERGEVNERVEELAASADTSDSGASFMSPENAPPKRRGRPKGSKNKTKDGEATSGPEVLPPEGSQSAAEQIEANKQFLQPVFGIISQAGVKLAGSEKAAIGPNEMVVMVDSAARCVHQYLPNVVGQHTNLVVFSLTVANWGVRVYALREETIAELKRRKAAQATPDANMGGSNHTNANDIVPPGLM